MSIAVLRTFISKRKLEHEAMLAGRVKTGPKVPDESVSRRYDDGMSSDEPCSTSGVLTGKLGGKEIEELKPARVLEALSASGLRALRYAHEVEGVGQVVALDKDEASVEACRRNIVFNGPVACSKLESHLADARVYMLTHPKEFDVVDLDPYGSPATFLDSAVQSIVDGGILMCTATDLAVLCGGNGEVCYSKYGSYPLRGKYCHEMALRILLASIESHANRYKRHIVPILSVQMDFYIRVFVRIYSSASAMKNTPLKLSYVYQCTGCDSFHLQSVGRTISKELPDIPLFLSLHNISATLNCASPSAITFRSALINAGYRVSGTHVNPLGLKTPMHTIWDIMRCWVKKHPVKAQSSNQAGSVILAKEPVLQANFSRDASVSKAHAKKVARFLPNPKKHWGPKLRAGRQTTERILKMLVRIGR